MPQCPLAIPVPTACGVADFTGGSDATVAADPGCIADGSESSESGWCSCIELLQAVQQQRSRSAEAFLAACGSWSACRGRAATWCGPPFALE